MILRSANQRIMRRGELRVSSSGMWRLAPLARVGQISQTDASKEGLATWETRSPAAKPNLSKCQCTSQLSEACWICTPFGRPVEPDV